MFGSKKILSAMSAIVIGAAVLVTGCGGGDNVSNESSNKITASGSTALLPLLKPAQEIFQQKNNQLTINISGGGSFTGMNQVASGSVDIGNSDVNLPEEYKDKGLVDHKVVVEPFVFIVDKANTIDNISEQQAIDILTGKITNWNEIGGANQKITLIHRAKSSGSRATISEVVLKGTAFTDDAVILDSNGAVRTAVASTPGAIGYVDAPYADDSVNILKFNGIEFTAQNIIDGKYLIYGYGHMYTKGEPTGVVKEFIDYVMSDEFQNSHVENLGFIPVGKMKH
ncbi:MAG: phosphate ABC transporter substrate-binding protein [Selenomonadaceae bacterium]|nr:phosphate ABC transporter substrate-binding protein [Selenomonadaceae bacterium]